MEQWSMGYLELAKKAEANLKRTADGGPSMQPAPVADPTEGPIIAVLIDSPIVGLVWFALDDGWKSGDDIPVFYRDLPEVVLQRMRDCVAIPV
jgi:hypothetical protein